MASPMDHHKSGLARLHQSEEFSDCRLICDPYHFNLHKVILASQSDYFRAAFKQGTFKEGDSGIIELKTAQSDSEASVNGDDAYDEPEIVKLMVEYFYHFDYLRGAGPVPARATSFLASAMQSSQLPSQVHIIEHAKVFSIAVKYQIDGLRDLAASKFKDDATAHWNHKDFAHSIHIAFNSTAEEVTQLREIVTNILHQHFDYLQAKAEVETVICIVPRLAQTLLKSRAGGKNGGKEIGMQNHSAIQQAADIECDECGRQLVRYAKWGGDLRCPLCY